MWYKAVLSWEIMITASDQYAGDTAESLLMEVHAPGGTQYADTDAALTKKAGQVAL